MTGRIGFCRCDSIGSPMLVGISRPRIVLPQVAFEGNELYFVLKHELVHYKRKDLCYKLLVLAATAIHWFNPIVYLMAKAIGALCEMSCDDNVIHCASDEIRWHYSETIIGVVKYHSGLNTALSTSFNGGKKGMKKRILSIMDHGRKRAGILVICAVMLLTM